MLPEDFLARLTAVSPQEERTSPAVRCHARPIVRAGHGAHPDSTLPPQRTPIRVQTLSDYPSASRSKGLPDNERPSASICLNPWVCTTLRRRDVDSIRGPHRSAPTIHALGIDEAEPIAIVGPCGNGAAITICCEADVVLPPRSGAQRQPVRRPLRDHTCVECLNVDVEVCRRPRHTIALVIPGDDGAIAPAGDHLRTGTASRRRAHR